MNNPTCVPWPWTPIEIARDESATRVAVWNRAFEFANSPFPASIQTGGEELLAAPIRLRAAIETENGETQEFEWEKTTLVVSRRSDDAVTLSGSLFHAEMQVSVSVLIEFDGLIRFDCAVTPLWNSSPRLAKLHLEIPIRPERATLFTYWPVSVVGSMPDHTASNSGALPETGLALGFKPSLWLGWEDGGLAWAAESDEAWKPADAARAMEVERSADATTLRLRLLDSQPEEWRGRKDLWTSALAPRTFSFGLQPTPVKPMPRDFLERHTAQLDYSVSLPSYRFENVPMESGSDETILEHLVNRGVRVAALHEAWTHIQNSPDSDRRTEIQDSVRSCHARGIRVIPYRGYEFSTLDEDWAAHHNEWVLKDSDGNFQGGWQREPAQRDYIVCYNSAFSQKWLDGVQNLLDVLNFDGVYLDGTAMPWGCANAAHGCGYEDAGGARHVTYPVFALRATFRRLYEIVASRGGIIDAHQSGCCVAPILSFVSSYWDGEHLGADLVNDPDSTFGLASFRAEFMGRNFGVPCEFLGTPESTPLALLHNVLVRPGVGVALDLVAPLWKILSDFGVAEAEWHPYWANENLVSCTSKRIKISFYHRQISGIDRVLLVAVNLHDEATTATGKLDFAAFGCGILENARDTQSGEIVPIENGAFALDIAPRSMQILRFG